MYPQLKNLGRRCAMALAMVSLPVLSGLLCLLCLFGGVGLAPGAAIAAIREFEEAPGQVVYQSRHTLQDQQGRSWQAIAFKRIRANGDEGFFLRLVGFPGTATIDRSLPLRLDNSLGTRLTAADASAQIFTDSSVPEPHVGQYDLAAIAPQLRPELPWQLTLPTVDQEPIRLELPPLTVQDWQTLARTH